MRYYNYYDEHGEEQWVDENSYRDNLAHEEFAKTCIHESTYQTNEKLICAHCGDVLSNLY